MVWLYFLALLATGWGHTVKGVYNGLRTRREVSCGGSLTGSGEIVLPTVEMNGTMFYKSEESCEWTVSVAANQHVVIHSLYFDLELSDNCEWDYLEISEVAGSSRFCAWDPLVYVSTGHQLTLRFRSDYSYESQGFHLVVTAVADFADDTFCNSTISIKPGEKGSLYNKKDSGENCYYHLQAEDGYVVELKVRMVTFGAHECNEERLLIRDGVSSHAQSVWEICSEHAESARNELRRGRNLFIEYANTAGSEGERFQLDYVAVLDNFTPPPPTPTTASPVGGDNDCSGRFLDSDGFEFTYTAPEFKDNKFCVLTFRATIGHEHKVQIEFLKFDMEESDDCMFDSLKVFASERNGSDLLGGPYCGTSLAGRTLLSNGNSMRLEFKTDNSLSFVGFTARVKFVSISKGSKDCGCARGKVCVIQGYELLCVGGTHCEMNTCDNGGTCVKDGHKETCHCMTGYSGELCRQGGSSAGYLEFEERPQDRTVKRQKQATAFCAVKRPTNGDLVEYSWLFEGQPILEYRKSIEYGDKGNGLLEIKKFNEQNEGQYTCLARAGNLTAEHIFSMTMVNDCKLEGFKGPRNEEGIVGNMVFLTCAVVNAKNVLWKKDGKIIDYDENTRMKHLLNNYLQITDLKLEDEGDYSCEATDFENCGSEKTAHLTVYQKGVHNDYCGRAVHDQVRESIATAYISKGDDSNTNEHPWHVTMLRPEEGGNGRLIPFCGATVISQNYLVTAAHCILDFPGGKEKFTPENVKLNFASARCFTSDLIKSFKRCIIHEDFNKTAPFDSDIALIELDEPLEYSAKIRPVCLEDAKYNDRRFLENRKSNISPGKVVGCGKLSGSRYAGLPDTLQRLHLPYVSNEDCAINLNKFNGDGGQKVKLTDNIFCAGRLQRGVGDVCPGDSGGGLLMEAIGEFRWVLTGIVSFGMGGCDNPDYYSMFTNVGNFYDWINDHTHFTKEVVDTSFLD